MRSVKKGQTKPYDKAILRRINKAASAADNNLELNLKWMLLSITTDKKLKKIFEMYTYFRDHQPEEIFEWLHNILTHPALDTSWDKILKKEHGGKPEKRFEAFRGVPIYKKDHRHPFLILAGAYYCYRSSKRRPAFFAANEAISYLNIGDYDNALEAFKEKFSHFKPRGKIEKSCQKIILEQIQGLEKLDDLNDPTNDETITTLFHNIQKQITKLRDIYDTELEAGMKYGCTRCYIAAQCLDLQQVRLLIEANADLSEPDVITLFQRIENRSKIAEQEHYTVGALLSGVSYLRIAEALHKKEQFIKAKIPPCTLFAVHKPCGFSNNKSFSPRSQLLQALRAHYQEIKMTYFEKALTAFRQAEALEATGNNTAHTYNTTGGKGLSSTHLLTQKEIEYESISHLREHVEHLVARLCPRNTYDKEENYSHKEHVLS